MEKFMLGRKIGMTQVFDEDGLLIPVTVIEAGPITVVQKKKPETDGYNSVRVAFGDVQEKRLNKPEKGLFAKLGIAPKKYIREKWHLLARMIPLVENNYNLCELGPRGTGKSHVYKEISPNSILVSGGQTTIANLYFIIWLQGR